MGRFRRRRQQQMKVYENPAFKKLKQSFPSHITDENILKELFKAIVNIVECRYPKVKDAQFDVVDDLRRTSRAVTKFNINGAVGIYFNRRLVTSEESDEKISLLLAAKSIAHELAHWLLPFKVKHRKLWKELFKDIAAMCGITVENPRAFDMSEENHKAMGGKAGSWVCSTPECRYVKLLDRSPPPQRKKNCPRCKCSMIWKPKSMKSELKHPSVIEEIMGDDSSDDEEPLSMRRPPRCQRDDAKEPTSDGESTDEEPIGNRLKNSNPPATAQVKNTPLSVGGESNAGNAPGRVEMVNSSSGGSRLPTMFQQSPNPNNTRTYTMESERKDEKGGVIYQETQEGKHRGKLRVAWVVDNMKKPVPVSVKITAGEQGVRDGSVIKFPIPPSNNAVFILEDAKVESNGDIHCFLRKRCYHDDNGTPSAPLSEEPKFMSARCNGNVTFGASGKRAHERFVLKRCHDDNGTLEDLSLPKKLKCT